jgi:poly-gamma-glutamate synthesis protein (capsule biosynthesis protein)
MIKYGFKIGFFLVSLVIFSGCSLENGKVADKNGEKVMQQEKSNFEPSEKSKTSILFVGDLMFDRYIAQVAAKKGDSFIFSGISSFLKENDLVVANLEGPITDKKSISIGTVVGDKGHFSFTFNKSLAGTLVENNIRLVNIGNNHILNFKEEGLNQTKKYLEENKVNYFGDPENKEKNYIIEEINGIKIGFVSFNQFGGSAEETKKDIETIKGTTDIIIVYAHWGKEYSKIPSENIKIMAHNFIDSGADLVIGSHPHVIQNTEEYKRKRIYYSLGNFIFDQYFSAETMKGLAVEVIIDSENKNMEFHEFPLLLQKNGQTLPKLN